MDKKRGLVQEIIHDIRTNRFFMSRIVFEVSMWSNIGMVFIYLIETLRLSSIWMAAVAAYYACIALTRAHLAHIMTKVHTEENEEKRRLRTKDGVRSTGFLMLILTMVFAYITVQIAYNGNSFHFSRGVFLLVIVYTLWGFWVSFANAIRDRGKEMLLSALRLVNLSAATTGLYILFAAMFESYWVNVDGKVTMLIGGGGLMFILLMGYALRMMLLSEKNQEEVNDD